MGECRQLGGSVDNKLGLLRRMAGSDPKRAKVDGGDQPSIRTFLRPAHPAPAPRIHARPPAAPTLVLFILAITD